MSAVNVSGDRKQWILIGLTVGFQVPDVFLGS